MNILLENGLPEEIDGAPIYADFRNMIRFDIALNDEDLRESEKMQIGLIQLFEESHLPNEPIKKLLWFYSAGKSESLKSAKKQNKSTKKTRLYDFEQDADYIFAGFLQTYNINLATVNFLHWWEFLPLLAALPQTTTMGQIMMYRTANIEKIKGKEQKKFYEEQKKKWEIKRQDTQKYESVQEKQTAFKQRLNARLKEVGALKDEL